MATLQMQAAELTGIAFQLQGFNSNAINPTSEVHLACVFNTHARLSSLLPPNCQWAISTTRSDEQKANLPTIPEWASLSTASIGHIVYDGRVFFELAAINRNHIYAYGQS
ncbi:hypothetical protein BC827DRAFT_1156779 [Russula dissimulans]|nr:hypothetical protein BC827DRAFT_1156779 [Russula dissimulans]